MIFQFIYFAFLHDVLNKISPKVGESGFQNPGNFCLWNPGYGIFSRGIRDLRLWNPEYNSRNPEAH